MAPQASASAPAARALPRPRLRHLSFRASEARLLRRHWLYFSAVVLYQLFAVFQPNLALEAAVARAYPANNVSVPVFDTIGHRHGWNAHKYSASVIVEVREYLTTRAQLQRNRTDAFNGNHSGAAWSELRDF